MVRAEYYKADHASRRTRGRRLRCYWGPHGTLRQGGLLRDVRQLVETSLRHLGEPLPGKPGGEIPAHRGGRLPGVGALHRGSGLRDRSTGGSVGLGAVCDTALQFINQLLLLGDQLVRDALQILDHVQRAVLPQVVQGLRHGDLTEVGRGAHVHPQIQPQPFELGEVEVLHHLADELLRLHPPRHGVNGRLPIRHHRLLKLPVHDHGPLSVVGAHHVQQDTPDVLHPLVKPRSDVLQRDLGVGLQNHQGGRCCPASRCPSGRPWPPGTPWCR